MVLVPKLDERENRNSEMCTTLLLPNPTLLLPKATPANKDYVWWRCCDDNETSFKYVRCSFHISSDSQQDVCVVVEHSDTWKSLLFLFCFFWADLKSIHQVKHHSNLLFASKIIKYTLLPLKYLFHHFQFCHHLKHKICIATKSTSFMPLTPTWVNIVIISHICTRAHICLRRRIIYNYTGSRGVLVERS